MAFRFKKSHLLPASLAANVFLVGALLIPLVMCFDRPDIKPHGGPQRMIEDVAEKLTPSEADKLRLIFREEIGNNDSRRDRMRPVMKAVANVLRQDTPDPAALAAALDQIAATDQQMNTGMTALMMRVAAELSPASRRVMADVLDRGPPPKSGKGSRP